MPSGNFGNLTAGLLATRLGLKVKKFVAATNRNAVVPEYLSTGVYQPQPSMATISNAMDVGAPSNFVRMLALFGNDWMSMAGDIDGMFFDDDSTRAAIREVQSLYQYQIDPHGAVGWLAARKWRAAHPGNATIVLETAHPAKFLEVMEAELGLGCVEIPERLACLAGRIVHSVPMGIEQQPFLAWLRAQIR